MAREVVHQLDIAQDNRPLSQQEIWLRNNLKKKSLALASFIHTIARIRSRISWLKDGDANTALFHLHAWHRQRRNFIARLQEEGQVHTDHEAKAEVLLNYYSNLLGTEGTRDHTLNLDFLGIQQHDLAALDASITEEEVWGVIKKMPSDKAPAPMD